MMMTAAGKHNLTPGGMHRAGGTSALLWLVLLLPALITAPALGADTHRTNAVGTWSDANWNNGVPTITDTAYIGAGVPGLNSATVEVDAAGALAADVLLGYSAGQTGRLDLTGTGSLTVVNYLKMGYARSTSILNIGTNAALVVSNTITIGGNNTFSFNAANLTVKRLQGGENVAGYGTQNIAQTGGTLTMLSGGVSLGFISNAYTIYTLTNNAVLRIIGTAAENSFDLGGNGQGALTMAPGTAITCYYFNVANQSAFTYRPQDVAISSVYINVGNYGARHLTGSAVFVQDGGTATFVRVRVGSYAGTGSTSPGNGVYCLSNGATLRASGDIYIRLQSNAMGHVTGWGTINAAGLDFNTSGRVEADGFGADHDLIITNVRSIMEYNQSWGVSQPNGSLAGWYAVNGGRLRLKTPVIVSGTTSTNWGETPTNAAIHLVNSLRMAFSNVTGGALQIALLAPGRADASVDRTNAVIGVWDFDTSGGFSFGTTGSVTLTFRYDNALAATKGIPENTLRVWQWGVNQWEDVTAALNTNANVKTIETIPLASFTKFAISDIIPNFFNGMVVSIY